MTEPGVNDIFGHHMAELTRNESFQMAGMGYGMSGAGFGIEHGLLHLPLDGNTVGIDVGLGVMAVASTLALIHGFTMPKESRAPRLKAPRTRR